MTVSARPLTGNLAAILVYDGVPAFEYGIAHEIFGLVRPELGVDWYNCRTASIDGGDVSGSGNLVIRADGGLELLDVARTIVIPGWRDRDRPAPAALLAALRRAHARGARIVTICSGSFLVGAAGLLDGRRATTHWRYAEAFRRQFPHTDFEPDMLYVDEGNILTAAGSAAGIDACLHLIRRDFGTRIANMVARRLVMPPHREGGQAQYVDAPVAIRPGRTIGEALDWARARLDQPLSVAQLAAQAAMSERTFLRQFGAATGMSPKAWLERERLTRAQDLLENTAMPLDEVGAQCGYASPETFRIAFRRVLGTAPGAYRARFRVTDLAA